MDADVTAALLIHDLQKEGQHVPLKEETANTKIGRRELIKNLNFSKYELLVLQNTNNKYYTNAVHFGCG